MTREEEAKIIRAVVDGNTNAFEDLVLEYQKQVYHIALKMTGNEEDAFDLSQEAFLKAFRSLSTFRGEAGFGSCIFGAINAPKIKEALAIPEEQELKLMIALGKPAHESTVMGPREDGKLAYIRDDNRNYHVPKLPLDEVARFV